MNEQLGFLKELQTVLKREEEEDNDGQASPRFWTIGDYRMVPVPEGFEDETHIHLPTREYSGDINELIDFIKENELEDLTEEAQEGLSEIECEITALEWINEHYDEEAYLVPVRKEHFVRPDTMFLTKEEAKRHLKGNRHHYTSEAHTYAMTAWRAPKVEKLLDLLMHIDWDAVEVKSE